MLRKINCSYVFILLLYFEKYFPLSKAQVLGLCYSTLIHSFDEKLSIGFKISFDFENII